MNEERRIRLFESSKNQGATNVYINPRSTTTTSMHQECEKISQKEAPYKRVFQKCSVTITLLVLLLTEVLLKGQL